MIELKVVKNTDQVADARFLFLEYAATRPDDPALTTFRKEIEDLPGEYAPPEGGIVLVYCDGGLAGCVAVHRLDDDICEMKRLYVPPRFRGMGLGRVLAEAIIKLSISLGYGRMRLDSIPSMKEAQSLYESMGFVEIQAYRNNPNIGTKYFELVLNSAQG